MCERPNGIGRGFHSLVQFGTAVPSTVTVNTLYPDYLSALYSQMHNHSQDLMPPPYAAVAQAAVHNRNTQAVVPTVSGAPLPAYGG
jgi:hypothetical protein